jgi:hypothetical protein
MRERKAVLALYPQGDSPSRLLQSAALSGYVELRSYKDLDEARSIACEFIERHTKKYTATAFI